METDRSMKQYYVTEPVTNPPKEEGRYFVINSHKEKLPRTYEDAVWMTTDVVTSWLRPLTQEEIDAETVEFAEWMRINRYEASMNNKEWIHIDEGPMRRFTSEQLVAEFREEKQKKGDGNG